ncbi:asparagine synthase B [Brevibacterium daeguense]|uniref:asparagine synthase (glutamine-hydrolyzing) n=1 Tax=Brevibacterium daeguense TaxID=909936 RepID=A0ABP8EKJ0_9MICO|nr:asparagine synthase-related protein [Brevibacterium daeguense]
MSGVVAAHGPFDHRMGQRMLERLAHRGPDGSGSRALENAWVGSRYLSIVDPKTGGQPLSGGRNDDVWLTGDGMIHNFRRIRERMGAERFRTESDFETAVVLFDELGKAAFEQLWGPFALVIAAADGRFIAGRDVLGLAPLYWVRNDDTVIFASEMKAFDKMLRPDVEPFPPGHVWTPEAGLEEIREFPGASPVLLLSRAPDEDPPAWVFDAVRETLIRAVERSLAGAQPKGVLLSGGVDSSIVTAIAARRQPKGTKLKTFAVGLDDSGDLEAARLVAEYCGTDHRELIYTAQDAIDVVPRVVAGLESFDPTLVHSAVPNYFVSQLAGRHVKVVLVGEGADELFAGYSHYGQLTDPAELHAELLDTLRGMHIGGLQRVDRVAGALGMEPRLPFLDLDVVELAMALPPEWKLLTEDRPAKWLLRRAFDGWLPDEVLWRRKEQFGEGTGMNDVLRDHFSATVTDDQLSAAADVVDPPLRTREEMAYYRMFYSSLQGVNAQATVGRFAEA